MSCHQNGGAIFPRARWRETEANEEIAALIERARPGFLSQPNGGRRFDVPWAIDYATDQANYYSSYQRPQQTDARLACVRHTFEFVELEDTEVCLPLEILGRLVRRMLRANSAPVQAFALSAARPTGSPPNSRIASIRQGHK